MNTRKTNKQSGFTIIEVLIVLAIAGLIMLVVFLAVPALQRNARNNSRNNEAARLAAAITECMSNNNGQATPCDNNGGSSDKLDDYYDTSVNQQITAIGSYGESLNKAALSFSRKCNSSGTGTTSGGGSRAFAILYKIETGKADATRCISG